MNKTKFEVGKAYYSFDANEMFDCIERTEDIVTFQGENGAKHTLRTEFSSSGVEYTRLVFTLRADRRILNERN